MENSTPHLDTQPGSIKLFVIGQICYVLSYFNALNLDSIFKILSIISVVMVIIINWSKFIKAMKTILKKKK